MRIRKETCRIAYAVAILGSEDKHGQVNQAPVLARHGGVSLTLCPRRRAEGVDVCKRCLPHLKVARQVHGGNLRPSSGEGDHVQG